MFLFARLRAPYEKEIHPPLGDYDGDRLIPASDSGSSPDRR